MSAPAAAATRSSSSAGSPPSTTRHDHDRPIGSSAASTCDRAWASTRSKYAASCPGVSSGPTRPGGTLRTCTTVRWAPLSLASRPASTVAARLAGEPSTPTTISRTVSPPVRRQRTISTGRSA
jgi:hypothetical protein